MPAPTSPALIVTADDFGLAREVNEAVEAAHRGGILTAASLMVGAAAAGEAVAIARRLPSLRVGLHLVLLEDRPALPPSAVPDLVDAEGNFRRDLVRAGAGMFFRPSVRRQLAAEIAAQFEAFRATGLPLDHVNAHKHYHLHPTVAAFVLAIGPRYGMRALRVPLEPASVIRSIGPRQGRATATVMAPWSRLLGRRARRQGLLVPDAVFGLAWTGAMTGERIRALLPRLGPGVSEIYTHPATSDGFAGAAPGYRYAEELAGLADRETRRLAAEAGLRLAGFGDLS